MYIWYVSLKGDPQVKLLFFVVRGVGIRRVQAVVAAVKIELRVCPTIESSSV